MMMRPENMRLYNRAGLISINGAVTLSLPALELLLDWAREAGAATAMIDARLQGVPSDAKKEGFGP